MKQAAFSLLAAVFFSTASFAGPAFITAPTLAQQTPPVLCVIDGCNDPYPGPLR